MTCHSAMLPQILRLLTTRAVNLHISIICFDFWYLLWKFLTLILDIFKCNQTSFPNLNILFYLFINFPFFVGILTLYQDVICTLDFFHLAQYITKISGDVQGDKLFQSIAALNFNRQKFQQVLAFYKNRIPESTTR